MAMSEDDKVCDVSFAHFFFLLLSGFAVKTSIMLVGVMGVMSVMDVDRGGRHS